MRKGLSREVVAEAALAVAHEESLERISIRQVAAHLGVVPSALYGHIEDRFDIYRAMAEVAYTRLAHTMALAAHDEPDPVERLRTILRTYYRFAAQDRLQFRVLTRFRPQFSNEWSSDQLPAGSSALEIITDAVRDTVASGGFAPCDPTVAGLAMLATVRGTTMFALEAEPGDASANEALAFAALDTTIAAFCAHSASVVSGVDAVHSTMN